jgi:hypothetical protein
MDEQHNKSENKREKMKRYSISCQHFQIQGFQNLSSQQITAYGS